jgi:hypothetical protein
VAYYIDLKYLKLLPLEQFTDKGGGKYNFRCSICGDSKRKEHLKRAWAINYQGSMFIKCFNCDYSNSFGNFLKVHFPNYFPDYIKETYMDKTPFKTRPKKQVDIFANEYDSLNLQKIGELPPVHRAVKYLQERKIPKDISNGFYYTDEFSYWIHNSIDNALFSDQKMKDRRIVIPFYNIHKKIFAVQGRALDNQTPKYITIKTVESEDKIYGLDKIDFSKHIYVVEGPIDSLFLDNCVALAGTLSNLDTLLKHTPKENLIIVPDNDSYNYQTMNFIKNGIDSGYKMTLWPKNIGFKDINEAIMKGITKDEIYDIIQYNTFSGLEAKARFAMRKL